MSSDENKILSKEGSTPKIVRGALQVIGGAVPFADGLLSAAAGSFSIVLTEG